jgi:hypothetical protein
MEKESLIMYYIAVWGWHLKAMLFLATAFIIVFSGNSLGNNILFIAFLVAFIYCEVVAIRRRAPLQEAEVFGELNGKNE